MKRTILEWIAGVGYAMALINPYAVNKMCFGHLPDMIAVFVFGGAFICVLEKWGFSDNT